MKRSVLFGALAALALLFSAPSASAQGIACPARAELDAAPLRVRNDEAGALQAFRETAPCHHWLTFYFAAERMFANGQRDEAVRWFYVAQLRGRTVATLDANGSSRRLIDALQYIVGQPINEYSGADVVKWAQAAQWALDWDAANPLRVEQAIAVGPSMDFSGSEPLQFVPASPRATRQTFRAAYDQNRRGLMELRDMIAALDQEEVDRQRRANGLE